MAPPLNGPIQAAQARLDAANRAKNALIDSYFASKGFGYPDFTKVDEEIHAAETALKVAELMNKSTLLQDGAAVAVGIDGLGGSMFTPSYANGLILAQSIEKATEAAAFGGIVFSDFKSTLDDAASDILHSPSSTESDYVPYSGGSSSSTVNIPHTQRLRIPLLCSVDSQTRHPFL